MRVRNETTMRTTTTTLAAVTVLLGTTLSFAESRAADRLSVCATVPDLGSLARDLGGEDVSVTVFVPPMGDAHFLEARPSFVKALSRADLFLVNGLDLEVGWAPVLWENARNPRVLPGGPGFLDGSLGIEVKEQPAGVIDRAMGDVHPYGNPHYLLDPVNGLRVAERLRDALIAARPAQEKEFKERFTKLKARLGAALVGEELAKKYDVLKLSILHDRGKLMDFLKTQGDANRLGGWLSSMLPFKGKPIATDHNLWTYFAWRFGLEVAGTMEPKPGIPPSTKHLAELVETIKKHEVKVVLQAVYYDPQYANFLVEKAGVQVVPMAHQVGSRPGTDDYVAVCDYNVKQVVLALGGKKK
jgi:ABC-type Zn uptake system ZnuABC Zn-binding protein ZnuA